MGLIAVNVFNDPTEKTQGYPAYPAYPSYPDAGRGPRDEDGDGIDLRAVAQMLWRGKWILFICALFALAAAMLIVSGWEPRYRAAAKVLFNPEKAKVVDLEEVLSADGGRDSLANELEILRSTALIERVVDKLGLAPGPEAAAPAPIYESSVGGVIPVPAALRPQLADLGLLPPPQTLSAEETARRARLAVVENLRWGLGLRPVPNSRVVELSFEHGDPRRAALIVNTVAEQYILDQLEAKLEATRGATAWLAERVEELRLRVQQAEEAVEAARAEIAEEAGQGLGVLERQLGARNDALADLRNTLSEMTARVRRIEEALAAERDFGAVAEFRASAVMQGFLETERELLAQQAKLRVGPEHPARLRLETDLAALRANMEAEAGRIALSVKDQLVALQGQETALVAEIRGLEQRALAQSKSEVRLRQLERDAQASRLLYENFLARQKETAAQQDLQTADARVLSPAETPVHPIAAKKRRTVLMAGILGLAAGIGILVLLERLNNTFRAREQIEQMAGVSVLAMLPALGRRMHRAQVLKRWRDKPNSALGEAVRNLRTSILLANIDHEPKVVMMTSSVPREGKSTTSMLLALTSRQMGKSTIIVDCDLRIPALATLLPEEEGEKPGLLAALQGEVTVEEAVYEEPETGLHVLMARTAESKRGLNAADVLSTRRFRELVKALSAQYDLVILDTPPTLVVSDPRIVSSHADAVIYAVRWDSTPRGAVLEGLKELRSVNAPVAGVVMTMVNEARAAKYSYDGYGYYKNRYRGYYSD